MSFDYWNEQIKDRWFFGALTVSSVAVVWLFWPYFYVLLFAAVTVVVTWGAFQRVLGLVGKRKGLAAVITFLLLALLVFVPTLWLVYIFVVELNILLGALNEALSDVQNIRDQMELVRDTFAANLRVWREGGYLTESVEAWMLGQLESDGDLAVKAQGLMVSLAGTVGSGLPALVSGAVKVSLDVMIYIFAVLTFYIEGPNILGVIKNLSPMKDNYDQKLFNVFGEFSQNMVVGSVATAAIQGVVASIGYMIVGVEGIVLLGIFTAITSFVPIVGTLAVWVPVSIYVAATSGWAWALFVVLWSIAFTGTVDNLLRPLFMKGSSEMHAFLIFLSVFGGLSLMGMPGALVGPVIVAMFMALYDIYRQDFMRVEADKKPKAPGWGEWLMAMVRGVWGAPLAANGVEEAVDVGADASATVLKHPSETLDSLPGSDEQGGI